MIGWKYGEDGEHFFSFVNFALCQRTLQFLMVKCIPFSEKLSQQCLLLLDIEYHLTSLFKMPGNLQDLFVMICVLCDLKKIHLNCLKNGKHLYKNFQHRGSSLDLAINIALDYIHEVWEIINRFWITAIKFTGRSSKVSLE